ncbi:MAG TPA: 1-acyl-sn-glycerol-3-phosphate acyltransferase [Desulfomonilaceae bacterium]|nr:1-acyl-sn-glycerol-3-phosphate acyltransferase [Desulfomonilaceae bacterium]
MKKVSPETVPLNLRNGRFHHIDGVLDQEPPWILRKLIPILSPKVQIDSSVAQKLQEMAKDGPIVYAMKYRSVYDLNVLRMRFAQLGLPLPAFVFGVSPAATGSVAKFFRIWQSKVSGMLHDRKMPRPIDEQALTEILKNGGAAVFFLVDEKTSRDRYIHPEQDPIRVLLNIQGQIAGSIAMIPLFVLYDRTPRRIIRPFWETLLGDPDKPGPLKRFLLALRKWTVPELLVGEPVHLVGQFEEFGSGTSWEELPFDLRTRLVDALNARIRVNRGPEKRSRTEIKEKVLQDARMQRAVGEAAQREGAVEEKIRRKAEAYVDEIAADARFQVHHFLYYVLKRLFSRVFDGIDLVQSEFSVLKKANAQGSLIYVSCHKSHFDYLLIGFLSFINHMAIPHMAAGKNLSFWPIGPVLRHAGAFFIRRSFRGLSLYPHVFAAYLKVLVHEKVNINFYIEGGRSRTGKLLAPRLGMLAFLLQTIEEGAVDDLNFVPTFIGYDLIPEEKSYLRELAGKDKQKESFLSFVRAREVLKKRFGKAYVRFHEPVSFKEFCRKSGVSLGNLSTRENRKLLQDFAYHLMSGIVRAGVITPIELAAAGIACAGKKRISRMELQESIDHLYEGLRRNGFELAGNPQNIHQAVGNVLGVFQTRKFLEIGPDSDLIIDDQRRANLDFYKNALVNYLWPESLVATIMLNHEHMITLGTLNEEFGLLVDICSKELILDPLTNNDELLMRTLSFFAERGWIEFRDKQITLLDKKPLISFKGILADLLTVYYLALAASDEIDGGLGQKDYAKRMVKTGRDLYADTRNRVIPSIPSVTLTNALTRFSEMGVFQYRQSKKFLKAVQDNGRKNELRDYLACAFMLNSLDAGLSRKQLLS